MCSQSGARARHLIIPSDKTLHLRRSAGSPLPMSLHPAASAQQVSRRRWRFGTVESCRGAAFERQAGLALESWLQACRATKPSGSRDLHEGLKQQFTLQSLNHHSLLHSLLVSLVYPPWLLPSSSSRLLLLLSVLPQWPPTRPCSPAS